jgi:hypothetical protein
VRVTVSNGVLPPTAAARDVTNAWWEAVARDQIKDPNILCLSRDPEAYDIQNEEGDQVILEEGEEVFLIPLNKTNPEGMTVDVTWDGLDAVRQTLILSISPTVHRAAPRSRLLALWIEHFKTHPHHAEVASHLFTDENEYYWRDEPGSETAPPCTPGQQVIFKMKPWLKENTASRQQKRQRPPPSDGQDPLGPFAHFCPSPPSPLTGGAGGADEGTPTQPAGGEAGQLGQCHSLARPCPTR